MKGSQEAHLCPRPEYLEIRGLGASARLGVRLRMCDGRVTWLKLYLYLQKTDHIPCTPPRFILFGSGHVNRSFFIQFYLGLQGELFRPP